MPIEETSTHAQDTSDAGSEAADDPRASDAGESDATGKDVADNLEQQGPSSETASDEPVDARSVTGADAGAPTASDAGVEPPASDYTGDKAAGAKATDQAAKQSTSDAKADDAQAGDATTSPSEIQATPESGATIGPDALQPGDVILTTPNFGWGLSEGIRAITDSPISHTMVYAGDGTVVEATSGGVQQSSLEDALQGEARAIVMRHKNMDAGKEGTVRDYLGRQLGGEFDYDTLVAQPFGTAGDDPNQFICSELAMKAYDNAGLETGSGEAHHSSPNDFLESDQMEYQGEINTDAFQKDTPDPTEQLEDFAPGYF